MSFLEQIAKRVHTPIPVVIEGVGTAHVRRLGVHRLMIFYEVISSLESEDDQPATTSAKVDMMVRAVACFLCDEDAVLTIATPNPSDDDAEGIAALSPIRELGIDELTAIFEAGTAANQQADIEEDAAKN